MSQKNFQPSKDNNKTYEFLLIFKVNAMRKVTNKIPPAAAGYLKKWKLVVIKSLCPIASK